MPRPHPPEFRARVVELAHERAKPLEQIVKDPGISANRLRGWVKSTLAACLAISGMGFS